MIPKLLLATCGKSTYVFLDGKCISEGVLDLKYSALDEEGKLCPTVDMKIDVNNFSFEGMSVEEFLQKSTELKRMFQRPSQNEKTTESLELTE